MELQARVDAARQRLFGQALDVDVVAEAHVATLDRRLQTSVRCTRPAEPTSSSAISGSPRRSASWVSTSRGTPSSEGTRGSTSGCLSLSAAGDEGRHHSNVGEHLAVEVEYSPSGRLGSLDSDAVLLDLKLECGRSQDFETPKSRVASSPTECSISPMVEGRSAAGHRPGSGWLYIYGGFGENNSGGESPGLPWTSHACGVVLGPRR